MTSVPDDGPRTARLVLVGEAYGDHEMRWQRPFVGPSGQVLEHWWRERCACYVCASLPWVPLPRRDFYITNAWDGGKPAVHIDAIPRSDMEMAFDRLHERLAALDGPDGGGPFVIVPTGNYALYALTGKGQVSWHKKDGRHPRPGITSWRGSILEYVDARGRRIKVIPTIHPAATFRTASYERECRHDWTRVAADSHVRALGLPERTHLVGPSLGDCHAFLADARTRANELSIDIETPRRVHYETEEQFSTAKNAKCATCGHTQRWHCEVGGTLDATAPNWCAGLRGKGCAANCTAFTPPRLKPKRTRVVEPAYLGCIGFGFEVERSLTIPTTREYWRNEDDYREAMQIVRDLCALDVDKVLQNGLFDVYWLEDQGIEVTRYYWDTRAMHHLLDTTAPHDLASLGVWYTRQPYWKDEAKDPDEIMKYASNTEALWTYNGIDVCVTLEVFYRLREELTARGRLETYRRLYADRLPRLRRLSRHGVRVDAGAREAKRDELAASRIAVAEKIAVAAGLPLCTKAGGLSTLRLRYYLYGPGGVTELQAGRLAESYPTVVPLRLPKQYAPSSKKGVKKGERSVSTNEVIVRRLMQRFPTRLNVVGELILEHRRVSQLATFVQDTLTDVDGRARCGYSPAVDTGRFSSQKNPKGTGRNLQNVDRELRSMYIPD